MSIRLGDPETRVLEAFCRRQLRWDGALPARVMTAERALGVFTVPPMGVLVFFAVPTIDPVLPDEAVDAIVPLAGLSDRLSEGVNDGLALDDLPRPLLPPGPAPSLTHLPPADGWQLPIFAVSGDLVPMVDEATSEFEARTTGLSSRGQETVAEEIWDRPGFGGVPMRALHAARQLGMMANDRAKVSAATCGPWRRLSTPRGQVFVYTHGPAARLALHVVR